MQACLEPDQADLRASARELAAPIAGRLNGRWCLQRCRATCRHFGPRAVVVCADAACGLAGRCGGGADFMGALISWEGAAKRRELRELPKLAVLAVLLAGRLGRRGGRRCASAQLAVIPSRVSLCAVFAEVTRGSSRGGGGRGSGCSLWVLGFTLIKPNTMRFLGRSFLGPKAHTAASHEQRRCA